MPYINSMIYIQVMPYTCSIAYVHQSPICLTCRPFGSNHLFPDNSFPFAVLGSPNSGPTSSHRQSTYVKTGLPWLILQCAGDHSIVFDVFASVSMPSKDQPLFPYPVSNFVHSQVKICVNQTLLAVSVENSLVPHTQSKLYRLVLPCINLI